MAETSQLEKVLSRHTRQHAAGHRELADSFKRLHSLVEQLSQHLSRQDLQEMLVDMNGEGRTGEASPAGPELRMTAEDLVRQDHK